VGLLMMQFGSSKGFTAYTPAPSEFSFPHQLLYQPKKQFLARVFVMELLNNGLTGLA